MKPDLKLKAWYESQMAGGGIAKTAKAAGKASERAVNMARDMAKKSKFKTLEPQVREQEGQYGVQRLERIFDEVPNIARQYEDQALLSALRGDNAQTLMIMRPRDFEKFASPLNISGSEVTKGLMPLDQYVRELGIIARDKGFEDVPFLELGKLQGSSYLHIPGHEGRHRMRALSQLGDETTLVRTIPRASVREPLPRRSRKEYLEALNQEHGNPLLVNPEDIQTDVIDLRRALPEQFAEGGEVAPEVLGGGTGIPYAKGGGIAKKVANASTKAAKKLSKKDISTIASELERSTGILPKVTSDYPFIKDVSVAKMEEIGGGEPITAYRALALYEGSPIRRETTPSTSIDPVVPFNILTGTPIIIKGNKFLPPEAVVRTYKGIEPTSTEVYVPSMIEEIAQRQPEALEMPYRFKSGEKGTVKDVFDAVEKEKELIADVSNLTPSDQFYKSGDGFNQSTYLNVARGVLSGQWKGAENYLKYQNFTDKPAAIQHLDMFAESIKNQYGKKRGGAIDHDLKNWYAASGGAASYTQSQQAQAKKASDIQSYREGKVGADELLSYFPGMTAAMIEAQLNPQEEPRMAAGGNPELDPMMEALSPDRESSSDPRLEAAGVIGKSLIKSMASPFVGIYGTLKSGKYGTQEGIRAGEEAIEEFMHPGDISPEAMPYVQDVGKFLEELETKYKIPPLLPEAMPLAGVRGVKPQVQNIVSGVNERIKELPPIPVGLSTENVGPPLTEVVKPKKPEVVKAPANELGLYSPAEKAILNMQRKQGSGEAFLSELKKAGVSNDELEFTRLNDFLKGKKAVTRDEVQKYIQDHRLEMREVEYRQGDIDESEFNFGDGEVLENDSYISDRADDYIREFDDYFPGSRERFREEIMDGYSKEELEDPYILERIDEEVDEKIREEAYENAQEEYYHDPEYEWTNQAGYSIYGNDNMGYYLRDPDGRPVGRGDYRNFEHAEGAAREDAMLQGLLGEGDTRFADYQLDNGQNYRELLLVAPVELPAKLTQEEFNKMSSLYALENKTPEQVAEYKELRARHRMANQPMEFTDSHWNEPDVLLHMRVQDRTTTDGKPMLYVDEMQSDWHQKGNEDGYMTTDQMAKAADLEDVMIEKRKIWEEKRNAYDEYNEQLTNQLKKEYFNTDIPLADLKKQDPKWEQLYREMTSAANDLDTARRAMKGVDAGVLDAPYKDNWHELGVKRILAYAARNGYDRVGFSASPAQIKRWGTQEIAWEKIPKQEMSKENFFKWAQDKFATTPDEPLNAYWDNQGTLYQAFKQTVDDSGGWQVAATEQRGGIAGRINLEADARARGVLKTNRSDRITTQEELRRIVDSSTRGLSEAQIDRITKKTWDRMQKQDAGITAPREEGMRAFYDNKLKKFAEKYAKKMGGEFYEAETKTGRGVVEGGGYGDVTEPVYVIELTPKLKDSAIKGQAYKKGGLVTQPKGWKYKGSRPCKDFKAQKFARGGAVRMQAGGNPLDQIRQQLAAGVPVHMSPGPEGVMARELIEEENRAREEAAKAKAQRVSNLPFMDKVRGGIEAGRTLQSIVGQEIAKPFVGLIGGEKKIAELEEGTPLPESEAGVQYLTNVAEALAPVGQAIQAAKIPDVPFLPELVPVSYVPGVGKQVAGIATRAAKKVDEIVPEGLKNLPVGGSTVPAPGTPSAAQAISGKVKVPADESGFYSPAEKAAVNLQRKSGSGQAFLNDISKQGVKKDELESTGLAEWLKSKPTVTKDEVVDYIHNNKIQIKEVMRSKDLSESEILKMEELERLISKGYYDIPQEDLDWFEATKKRYMASPPPKFDSEDLNLPGGKNYRELLLTLPSNIKQGSDITIKIPENWEVVPQSQVLGGAAFDVNRGWYVVDGRTDIRGAGNTIEEAIKDAQIDPSLPTKSVTMKNAVGVDYKSPHWEEPNVFAHIRMQDKDIDGKKTLVIEEIQSDWHQAGRDQGYAKAETKRISGKAVPDEYGTYKVEWEDGTFSGGYSKESAEAKALEGKSDAKAGVPDAPFKEDWYQVALKRAMRYAADNDYDAVAIVGGKEQANRYALSRKVDAIGVEKTDGGRNINIQTKGGGTLDLVVDDNGTVVSSSQKHFDRAVGKPITDVVGKSMGKKLMEMDKGVVSGKGLDIGGEGMVKYYDEIYPRYLEKQYKKYGVKPNQKSIQTKYYNENDVEMVETGEADRFGREMMAYKVTDPESGDVVSYEYSFEDAINAANRDVPKTNIWMMDIPTSLKSDVKIGQSYKKGGLVKDKRLQEWHMAGGGISKVGKVAKAAEKASKRMSRAESEAAGLWHQISETKLAKPVGEYKATVVEDPSAQMLPKKTITPEELQGGVAIPLAGDRAAAGRIIQEIEGVPMNVVLEGGPDFMRLHPRAAWASGKGVLSMLADRIKMARESGQPIYGVYTAMSPQAVDFNTMVTESLLNQLDISGLRKKDIKEFDAAVRQVKGQGNKPKAPNFPGLQDPELREKLMSGPGGQRDAFVKTMAKAGFQKKGFPDVAATRLAVTEPELLDIERGSAGYTIAKLDPEGRIVEQSGHTTYPLDILGEYAGGLENQLPVEIMYPTHFEAKRLMGSKPEGAHKSLELFAPLQYLDQNWLDNAMQYLEMQKKLTGRKKGGLAHAKV